MKMKFKIINQTTLDNYNKYKSEKGLKTSKKRSSIIEHFLAKDRHFSVEELYDDIKKIDTQIGYSTVYRTLRLLADCGLANECNFGDNVSRFEPVHEAHHHDHLICENCGRILEFFHEGIEKLQKLVARKYKFSVQNHKLELYGLCPSCLTKKKR